MRIIGASVMFVCDERFSVVKNGGVVFENGCIIESGEYEALVQKYMPESSRDTCEFFEDCVLLPALINAHIHFEFSSNSTSFTYGSFEGWLASVMARRDDVLGSMQESIESSINEQLDSGVGSVGAISSYGDDMEILAHSPLKVVYFSEVIGSNPAAVDMLFSHFKERFTRAMSLASKLALDSGTAERGERLAPESSLPRSRAPRFFPAIAIHSPYSVHSVLAKHVISFGREMFRERGIVQEREQDSRASARVINPCERSCSFSAHFLESNAERVWLESGGASGAESSQESGGWFYDFYTKTLGLKNPRPYYTIESFMQQFWGERVAFVHGVAMSEAESRALIDSGAHLLTCPRSNRLLGGSMLKLQGLDSRLATRLGIGSDGASSNANTNMLDELRAGLFGMEYPLDWLARILLLAATRGNASALGLANGSLEQGRSADMAVFAIKGIADSSQPAVHFIMLARKALRLYIDGEQVDRVGDKAEG